MFTSLLIPLEHWLTDVYLLSTVLLLAAFAVARRLTQPSRRMAAARSSVVGLVALAILATAPGWPRMAAIEWSSSELTPVTSEEARTTLIEPDRKSVV